MKSLKNRFIVLVVLAVLIPVAVVGVMALEESRRKSDVDTVAIMNLTCLEEADKIDAVLKGIEQSVALEAGYALRHMEDTDRFFEDEAYRKTYTEDAEKLFVEVAENTEGAVSFYYRYNAEEIESTQGFLYSRDDLDSPFERIPLTDISLYDPDDTEHVGWYYIPVRNGIPTWMEPYQNKNLGIYMISYVIPLFQDGRLIGIIGMDVNFQVIIDQVQTISLFDTGYAFLTGRDGSILYHPTIPFGATLDGRQEELPELAGLSGDRPSSAGTLLTFTYQNTQKKLAYTTLENGYVLSIVANTKDINAERDSLLLRIALTAAAIAVLFVLVAFWFTRRTLQPLIKLSDVADQVAGGNLDVEIPKGNCTELDSLIGAYNKTVERMRFQYQMVDELAHKDALTGLLNRSSFREREQALNEQIRRESDTVFAVVMIDVNDLKAMNDTYGHEAGDLYLKRAAKVITSVFGDDVFRIGGDEFAVILQADTRAGKESAAQALEDEIIEKTRLLEKQMEPEAAPGPDPWECFHAAYGASIRKDTDHEVAEVFERADNNMYARKAQMKVSQSR